MGTYIIHLSKSLKVKCRKRTDSNSHDNSKQNSNIQLSGGCLKTHCGFLNIPSRFLHVYVQQIINLNTCRSISITLRALHFAYLGWTPFHNS